MSCLLENSQLTCRHPMRSPQSRFSRSPESRISPDVSVRNFSVRFVALDLADVEFTTDPPCAFFKLQVRDDAGVVTTVMKRYGDLADFFDASPAGFARLPRHRDEAILALDLSCRELIKSNLDFLLRLPGLSSNQAFLEFFQLGDEYKVGRGSHALLYGDSPVTRPSPPGLTNGRRKRSPHVEPRGQSPGDVSSNVYERPRSQYAVSGSTLLGSASHAAKVQHVLPRQCFTVTSEEELCASDFGGVWDPSPKASDEVGDDNEFLLSMPDGQTKTVRKSLQRQSLGASSGPMCVVCMARSAQLAVDPCGHLCMCSDCASQLQKCPMCCGPVVKLLRVYVVT